MTKAELLEMYLADLENLVPDSDAKRSRVIDLEDELEALQCVHPRDRREYIGSNMLRCEVCGKEFN